MRPRSIFGPSEAANGSEPRAVQYSWAGHSFRVRPWRVGSEDVYLGAVTGSSPPSPEAVRQARDALAEAGWRRIYTNALNHSEIPGFEEAGFTIKDRLHLLTHSLRDLSRVTGHRHLRRERRSDRDAILAVDSEAFSEFWRFDRAGIREAVTATPTARVRVADQGAVVGYAISGRAGAVGYLQRLAVAPSHQGRGLGRQLVTDGLHWMRRRGARSALVNTQYENERAYQLYLDMGFRPEPEGLVVLECELVSGS